MVVQNRSLLKWSIGTGKISPNLVLVRVEKFYGLKFFYTQMLCSKTGVLIKVFFQPVQERFNGLPDTGCVMKTVQSWADLRKSTVS